MYVIGGEKRISAHLIEIVLGTFRIVDGRLITVVEKVSRSHEAVTP